MYFEMIYIWQKIWQKFWLKIIVFLCPCSKNDIFMDMVSIIKNKIANKYP